MRRPDMTDLRCVGCGIRAANWAGIRLFNDGGRAICERCLRELSRGATFDENDSEFARVANLKAVRP